MTIEERTERRQERIGKRWAKLISKRKPCPDCGSYRTGLNHCLMHKFKKYFLECEDCHWCGKTMPTIRMAIWSWNRGKSTEE